MTASEGIYRIDYLNDEGWEVVFEEPDIRKADLLLAGLIAEALSQPYGTPHSRGLAYKQCRAHWKPTDEPH